MWILASKSPRRLFLFKTLNLPFEVEVSDIDERSSFVLPIREASLDIAYRKGEAIKKKHPNDFVISADTMVILNSKVLHKPIDEIEAKEMLLQLSDKTHDVITSYCLFLKDKIIKKSVITKVTFNKLSDDLIEEYIATGSPFDKAGGYGIQDNAKFPLVKSFDGSLNNVIGLPIESIKEDLIKEGIIK